MRRFGIVAISLVVTSVTSPASGQAPVVMLLPGNGPDESCYDIKQPPNPKWFGSASPRADKAFAEYLAIAKVKGSLKKLFLEKKNWALDETRIDAVNAIDPWADRVQRYERTSLTVSNVGKYWFRGVWNAFGPDGQLLGRYDAEFQLGRGSAFFTDLHLFSPGSTAKAAPLTAFCRNPGDIQAHQEDRREREAKKAAKRAAQ